MIRHVLAAGLLVAGLAACTPQTAAQSEVALESAYGAALVAEIGYIKAAHPSAEVRAKLTAYRLAAGTAVHAAVAATKAGTDASTMLADALNAVTAYQAIVTTLKGGK
jgi:hypothetical protein